MLKAQLISLTLTLSFLASPSFGDIAKPAQTPAEIQKNIPREEAVQVKTAQILMANYDLIRRDFAQTRNLSEGEIDAWLLRNAGYIAKSQAQQSQVNTRIETGPAIRSALRPQDYKRALVFEAEGGGLIDGKGFGSPNPAQADHGNGLGTLGEMIREFLYQRLVQRIFDHSQSGLQTVASYAVIDWGFDVVHADGSRSRAGAILRQAHKRAPGQFSLFDDKTTTKIELILRRYGITSAGAYRAPGALQGLNIQGSADGAVIDFGGFLAVEKFETASTGFYGRKVLIPAAGLPGSVQPDLNLRVPMNIWGTTISGKEDPKTDNVWLWSHELAQAIAEGRADRAAADQHYRNLMNPVEQRLRFGGLCRSVMMN